MKKLNLLFIIIFFTVSCNNEIQKVDNTAKVETLSSDEKLKNVLYNKTVKDQNKTLKIMTYNVASGAKSMVIDMKVTAETIKKISPDIIGIQEVDVNTKRSGNVDQAKILADITGYNVKFGKTIDFDGGEYGIAILSKYPIIDSYSIQLPSSDEQRIALVAKIDVPGFEVPITFINTHLDWHENPEIRMAQIYALDEQLLDVRGIKIMCGDFNDTKNSDTIRRLERYWNIAIPDTLDHRTWPSSNPEIGLDYIFTSKAQIWETDTYIPNAEGDNEKFGIEWNKVSDHIPVITTLKLIEQ